MRPTPLMKATKIKNPLRDKRAIVGAVLERLQADLAVYAKAADWARSEATHEQSKPENKYDTRGLEASYLARGQSRQAVETQTAIEQFEALAQALRSFGPADPIAVGAVVEVRTGREHWIYLLGPRSGGTEVQHAGEEITVLTPLSPLGKQLMGRCSGEVFQVELGGLSREYRVVSVQ
jgi:transcription elongation GreA/GreB family factor